MLTVIDPKGEHLTTREAVMNLMELIAELEIKNLRGNPNVEIKGLTYDSRKVRENYLFVAIKGFKEDAHRFIPEAIKKGAKAIIVEKGIPPSLSSGVVIIEVSSSRSALAYLSNHFYGFPSQKLRVIGVTGTNGKTTTVYMIESILRKAGFRVGKLSSIDYNLGSEIHPSTITTPESQDLQRMLKTMVDGNLDYAIVEVSSHSLVLHRVEKVEFDWAVFTNLSSEHLDFHHSLDEYLKAKALLFKQLGKQAKKKGLKAASINIDDSVGEYIMHHTSAKVVTYGINKRAKVQGKILKTGSNGTSFLLKGTREKIELPLLGTHNVYNALAAASVALEEGIDPALIREGLEEVKNVPGRLEFVKNKHRLKIFVDYAHTPDGLKNILQTLRALNKRKLIVVFGCTGDRDITKRPLMGKIAFKLADYSILTSDDPHSEDPEEIISQIEKGIREEGGKRGKDYLAIVNRRQAIEKVLEIMKKEDIRVVAGKGHERVQIFKNRIEEFNDARVIKELLDER